MYHQHSDHIFITTHLVATLSFEDHIIPIEMGMLILKTYCEVR